MWICDFSLELTGHVGKNALHVGKIRVLVVIIDVDVGKIDVHVGMAFLVECFVAVKMLLALS